jgi:dihydroflavonol-4-reductase
MKIAITGASGHIGNNICRKLAKSGYDIKVLVHDNIDGLEQLPVQIVYGDILDPMDIDIFLKDADVVFHLAAKISMFKKDKLAEKINIKGTKNVISAALQANVKRLIHFSSIDAVDQLPLSQPVDELAPIRLDRNYSYNYSKAVSEKLVLDACSNGLNAVVLSPTAVLGPFDFMPSFAGDALIRFYQGKNPSIVPGGYDWVDVRDIANAAISAIEKGKSGEKYLLSGHWKSVAELAAVVAQNGGKKPPALKSPFWLAYLGVPFIRLIARLKNELPLYTSFTLETIQYGNKNIQNSKAAEALGFRPRSFEETISDTLQWFKAQKIIS